MIKDNKKENNETNEIFKINKNNNNINKDIKKEENNENTKKEMNLNIQDTKLLSEKYYKK